MTQPKQLKQDLEANNPMCCGKCKRRSSDNATWFFICINYDCLCHQSPDNIVESWEQKIDNWFSKKECEFYAQFGYHDWRLPDGIKDNTPDGADYSICDKCGELKKMCKQTNESIN